MNALLTHKFRLLKITPFIFTLLFIGSCGEDDVVDDTELPLASFSEEIADLTVTFTNNSQNATSYSWDFGDGETSTEENPEYTYSAGGTYTVVLTATNDAGESDDIEKSISVLEDPASFIHGGTSKEWKLLREGTAMVLNDLAQDNVNKWPGNSNDGTRPCLYDDTFTFSSDGSYTFDDAGTFWAEYGIFNGGIDATGCDSNSTEESCFEAIADNMVNECGDDVSAWLSGTHSYSYDESNSKITLSGTGAWIGIPKLGTSAETLVPASEVVFDVVLSSGGDSGVDSMFVSFSYAASSDLWLFTYVSYSDESLEPALVNDPIADFSTSSSGLIVDFINESLNSTSYSWSFGDGSSSTDENPTHTYDAEGTYTVSLTATSDNGSSDMISQDITISDQVLTTAAPTPTRSANNVISVYSDAYTDIDGVNLNPSWGQSTVLTEEVIENDNLVKMEGLNYQGIDFGGNIQDVSGMSHVHIDVWTSNASQVDFFLISSGPAETAYALEIETGVWKSYDIPLSEYSSVVDLTDVIQFKFDATVAGDSPTIYVDNIYFFTE